MVVKAAALATCESAQEADRGMRDKPGRWFGGNNLAGYKAVSCLPPSAPARTGTPADRDRRMRVWPEALAEAICARKMPRPTEDNRRLKVKLLPPGQIGDVMRESAQAAVHIHVPAGATPKDAPSAGVAMFIALASLPHCQK